MSRYIFENFGEVEETVKKFAPPVIYKYRSSWGNKYHKEFVTKQSMWFASPKELNDPYDIRTPIRFDVSEIEHPIFFKKLKEYYKINNPNLIHNERDIDIICENKMDEIRSDPKSYFEKNYKDIREGKIYDQVGLFSCTSDALNETMWAHYANNYSGFVVGFNTVEFSRNLLCGFGPVRYGDEVPFHSFIHEKADDDMDTLYLKSKKWEYEKEFRYITLGLEKEGDRAKTYPITSVVEFLIGNNFPEKCIDEFIKEVRKTFPMGIPIYKTQPNISQFGLGKTKIA